MHAYLQESKKRSVFEIQPLFGDGRSYTKSSMSLMHEGGEQSLKNDSIMPTSDIVSKYTMKRMQTISSLKKIEKPI